MQTESTELWNLNESAAMHARRVREHSSGQFRQLTPQKTGIIGHGSGLFVILRCLDVDICKKLDK